MAGGPKGDPDVLREVNDRVYDYALERDDPAHIWRFVCECSRPDCHEQVSLTLAQYELLREAAARVLAPEHT